MLNTVSGCVLVAVIAPTLVSGRLADLAALAMAIVAATRLRLLPAVLIVVRSTGQLRHALG
jgi:uncharacterized membrane protein